MWPSIFFSQVVIALTGGEIVYFEMDPVRKVASLNYAVKILLKVFKVVDEQLIGHYKTLLTSL